MRGAITALSATVPVVRFLILPYLLLVSIQSLQLFAHIVNNHIYTLPSLSAAEHPSNWDGRQTSISAKANVGKNAHINHI